MAHTRASSAVCLFSPLWPLPPPRPQSFPFDKQFMQLLVESYWDSNQTAIVWAEPAKIAQLLPDTMPDIVGCQCGDTQRQQRQQRQQ